MAQTTVWDNFTGGENRNPAEHLAPNELELCQGFIHTDGCLHSWAGRSLHSTPTKPVNNHRRVTVNGTEYNFASYDGHVYVDCGAASTAPRWRPIFLSGVSGAQYTSYQSYGSWMYFNPTQISRGDYVTRMMRWSNKYTAGTVTTSGNSTTLTGSGTTWNTTNIALGDRFYYWDGSGWQGGEIVVVAIGSTTSLTLSVAVNIASASQYIITRTHPAGIPPHSYWTGTLAATAVAGSTFAAGTWTFATVLKNSTTGYTSNPTYASVTTSAGNLDVQLGSYNTAPSDEGGYQADQLIVYRTATAGGSVYYPCKTVLRNQTNYTFPTTITVTSTDTMDTDNPLVDDHDLPPKGMHIFYWNGYLCGIAPEQVYAGTGATYTTTTVGLYRNRMYWSSFGSPEYWPSNEYGVVQPLDMADKWAGGYVGFGSPGNPLTGVAVEGANSTDDRGAGLLIMTRKGPFHRWFGTNHIDWTVEYGALNSTCVAARSVLQTDDLIGWWSNDGPVAKSNDTGNQVLPIYKKQFPVESRPVSGIITTEATKAQVCGAAWREYWVWAYNEGAATNNNRLIFYHRPTGTWRTLNHTSNVIYASDLAVWYDTNELYYVDWTVGSESIYELEQLTSTNSYWSGTTGVACLARTGWRVLHPYKPVKIPRMCIICHTPTAQQTLTVKVYTSQYADPVYNQSHTVATGTEPWQYIDVNCGREARAYKVEFSGTFTVPMTISMAVADEHGAGPNKGGKY